MPTLPAAGYNTPDAPTIGPEPIAGTPYQSGRAATPQAFGAASAAALSQFSTEAEKAAERFANIQTMFDQAASDDLRNQAEDKIQKLHYGDPDIPGNVGFRGLSGKSAAEAFPVFRKGVEAVIQEHRAQLRTLPQQQRFDQQIRIFRNQTVAEAGRHYDRQLEQYQTDQFNASMKNDAGKIATAAAENSPDVFDQRLGDRLRKIDEYGASKGWSTEQLDYEKGTARKAAVKEWVEATGTRDPLAALEFLERPNNKEAAGDLYPDLKNRLTARAKEQQAYRDAFPELVPAGGGTRGPTLVRGGAVEKRVTEAAREQGLDTKTALTIASLESRLGTVPDRPGSQYKGVYQLGNAAAEQAGGREVEHGVKFVAQTKASLTRELGREPTGPELYLAHQQGVTGAVALLNNPDKPAGTLVPRENISANKGNPDAPASAFVNHWRTEYERHASQLGGTSTAPAQPATSAGTEAPAPPAPAPPTAATATAPGAAAGVEIIDRTAEAGFGQKFGPLVKPQGMVIHHTAMGRTAEDILAKFKETNFPSQFIIDREGKIHRALPEGYRGQHTRNASGKVGVGTGNHNLEGIEIIANDDGDVLPIQQEAAARLVAQQAKKYGYDPKTAVYGHGELDPGRKQSTEGMSTVSRIRRGELGQVADAGPPGGGSGTSAPPGAGGDTAPPKITMVGDSLGAHPIRRGLAGGQELGKVGVYNQGDTAVAGWNPEKILGDLIPKLPDSVVRGQTVSLSTGISNSTKEGVQQALTETIPAQIAALRERGAKNIVLMGVGTDPKLAGVNDALAKIAEQNKDVGVVFAGPQRKTGGDKIHSSDQAAEVAAVQEALGKIPGATAAPIAPGATPTTQPPAGPTPIPPPPGSGPTTPCLACGPGYRTSTGARRPRAGTASVTTPPTN